MEVDSRSIASWNQTKKKKKQNAHHTSHYKRPHPTTESIDEHQRSVVGEEGGGVGVHYRLGGVPRADEGGGAVDVGDEVAAELVVLHLEGDVELAAAGTAAVGVSGCGGAHARNAGARWESENRTSGMGIAGPLCPYMCPTSIISAVILSTLIILPFFFVDIKII